MEIASREPRLPMEISRNYPRPRARVVPVAYRSATITPSGSVFPLRGRGSRAFSFEMEMDGTRRDLTGEGERKVGRKDTLSREG